MSNSIMRYFLGTSSPKGYITRFGELIDLSGFRCYILKGGPGFEKSQLMERLIANREGLEDIDEFHCSSDPTRLDAVIFHNLRAIVVDGAPPHAFEPSLPILNQTIMDLSECWELDKLIRFKGSIVRCYDDYRRLTHRISRFLSATSVIYSDTAEIAATTLNFSKLDAFVSGIISRTLPRENALKDTFISVEYRQLCAITPDGYKTFTRDIEEAYSKIYILKDNYFACSWRILSLIENAALSRGIKCLKSENPLFQDSTPEHLLIPELGIAFLTSNHINKITVDSAKNINCLRFYDKAQLSMRKQRIKFNKKTATELLSEAVYSLISATDVHDELEDYYLFALNPEALEERYEQLKTKLIPKNTCILGDEDV